jgi:hypothetical protein
MTGRLISNEMERMSSCTIPVFAWRDYGKPRKTSEQLVSGPGFEHGASRIQRSCNKSIAPSGRIYCRFDFKDTAGVNSVLI